MTDLRNAWRSEARVEKDILTLRRERTDDEGDYDRVYPAVNGRDLIALVRAVELPFAEADGEVNVAGSYDGLTTFEWKKIAELIEGQSSDARLGDGSVALLACECGITDCWPLHASFDITGDRVTIGDFFQPYRKHWRHDGLGPFVFSSGQVLREIGAMLAGPGNAA